MLITTVIGTAERGGRRWVHLDVGAFNGLMEALETGNTAGLPAHRLTARRRPARTTSPGRPATARTPSCTTSPLSTGLACGDHVYIGVRGRLHNGVRVLVQRLRRANRALRVRSLTPTHAACSAAQRSKYGIVSICNECLDLCAEIIEQPHRSQPRGNAHKSLSTVFGPTAARCHTCAIDSTSGVASLRKHSAATSIPPTQQVETHARPHRPAA